MKQVLQNVGDGTTSLVDIPTPQVKSGHIIVTTKRSLISTGTERMLVDFGKSSYFEKARKQPDKVKMVLTKVKADGLAATVEAVRSKLDQPIPLGYCNVGTVSQVGNGVSEFNIGQRVVSNGSHAEVVNVPKNLSAAIPDNVDDDTASFVVVASIGLQGIRLAKPEMGERFAVFGVGLIGLLIVQLLRAQGCRVLAIDFDGAKLALAKNYGADIFDLSQGGDPIGAGLAFSKGHGVDGVIVAASTKSSEPISQAAQMSRKRGRIVLVGVTGLEINRAEFYEKELSFQVSCSYGPGRYDANYEERGQDYPIGFVRWTEQRNFEAVLDLMASGAISVQGLISHRYKFDKAIDAYEMLLEDKGSMGILLEYANSNDSPSKSINKIQVNSPDISVATQSTVGFLGAGNYASRMLVPAFKIAGSRLHTVVSSGGLSSRSVADKSGFEFASTDVNDVIDENSIDTVVIATRHNTHAELVCRSLNAGKNVFVEKPLAISKSSLDEVRRTYEQCIGSSKGSIPHLLVGFNRRFSPHVLQAMKLLSGLSEPKSFVMTMNAGAIPADHWTQSREEGGGRIIGEACHYIDLMRYIADSPIVSVSARKMGVSEKIAISEDNASITLGFEDGSFGTIHYLANGASSFPKERIEIFCAGKIVQIDNFRSLKGYGFGRVVRKNLWSQDKGQKNCVASVLEGIRTGLPAIPIAEIFEVAEVSISVQDLLDHQ